MNDLLKRYLDEKLPKPSFLDDLTMNFDLVPDESSKPKTGRLILGAITRDLQDKEHNILKQLECYEKNFFDVKICLGNECTFNKNLCFFIQALGKEVSSDSKEKIKNIYEFLR